MIVRKARIIRRTLPLAALSLTVISFASPSSARSISAEPAMHNVLSGPLPFRLEQLNTATKTGLASVTSAPGPAADARSYGPEDPEGATNEIPMSDWDRRLIASGQTIPKRGWSGTLTAMEVGFQALNIIDMAQTMKCMDMPTCHETNPILGRRPSKLALAGFTAATGIGHFFVVKALSKTDRDLAKIFAITISAGLGIVVVMNYRELK